MTTMSHNTHTWSATSLVTRSAAVQTVVAQQWVGRIDELQRSITAGAVTTVGEEKGSKYNI